MFVLVGRRLEEKELPFCEGLQEYGDTALTDRGGGTPINERATSTLLRESEPLSCGAFDTAQQCDDRA